MSYFSVVDDAGCVLVVFRCGPSGFCVFLLWFWAAWTPGAVGPGARLDPGAVRPGAVRRLLGA